MPNQFDDTVLIIADSVITVDIDSKLRNDSNSINSDGKGETKEVGMRHRTHRLNARFYKHRWALIAVLAIAIPFTILACSQQPGSSFTATDKASDTATAGTGADAMKAYKDPKTGKLIPPPDAASDPKSSEAVKNATSTSSEGLEAKPAPGGGMMIDLKGRFQSKESTTTNSDKTSKPASAKKDGSHLKVYKDPETGKLGPPPDTDSMPQSAPTSSLAMQSATSTSSEGFEAEPAPGGGMMINLKGRFSSTTFATKDKNGKLVISHTPYKQRN